LAFRFDDLQANRFQDDLKQAAGFKPLLKSDLEQSYKRYESAGVKLGRVKGKSDADLYKMATNDVLSWWKNQKAEEARRAAEARQAAQRAAEQAARQQQEMQAAAQAAARNVGGNFGGGSTLLPDTAAGGGSASAEQLRVLQPVTSEYIRQQFERYNLWGAKPPAYALVTVGAFDQWVRSATKWLEEQRRRTQVAVRTSSGTQVVSSAIAGNRNPVIR
jgi:hypothetical protein